MYMKKAINTDESLKESDKSPRKPKMASNFIQLIFYSFVECKELMFVVVIK